MGCKYEGTGIFAGRCKGTREVDICPGYDKCEQYKPDYMTNADRIRAMRDYMGTVAQRRLIDANALIEEYDRVHIGEPGKARKLMEDAPTVDAVEVVRCKECIGKSTWFKDAETGCEICGMSGMYPKSEDGFCSYGIRKDGDD